MPNKFVSIFVVYYTSIFSCSIVFKILLNVETTSPVVVTGIGVIVGNPERFFIGSV